MTIQLGSGWVRAQPPPDPLDVPGFREAEPTDDELVEAAESAQEAREELLLSQIADAITALANRDTPVVSSEPPVLDTTGLSVAFAQALAALPRPADNSEHLVGLAKALDKLDRRVQAGAIGAGPGGGVSNQLLEDIKTLLTAPVSVSATLGYVKSAKNSTTAVLTAGQRYTGNWEALTNYEQLTVVLYGEPSTFQGVGTSAQGSLVIEFSTDGGATTDVFLPIEVADPGYFIPYPLIPVGTHYRLSYLNDGGVFAGGSGTPTTLTKFRLSALLHTVATKEIARTLSQTITDNQPVSLTRSVTMGKNPNGQYTNLREGGPLTLSPAVAPLGSSGVYQSAWFVTAGFVSLAVTIMADQVGAGNGVVIDFSNDGSTVRRTITRTYNASDVSAGSKYFAVANQGDYARITYTNGGVAQGVFFMEPRLNIVAVQQAVDAVTATVTDASAATMVRSIGTAKDPSSGTYDNITRSTTNANNQTGGHVAIVKHEVPTPIAALTSWKTGQATIASTTVPVNVIPAPTSGRKTFAVKNSATSTKAVLVGSSSADVLAGGWELAAGESVNVEVDTTTGCYALGTTAAAQTLFFIEIA